MTEAEALLEQIGIFVDDVYAKTYTEELNDALSSNKEHSAMIAHTEASHAAAAVVAKYTLQWAIKNVLFEQSSRNAIQEAIDELDKAWDARAK